jgi:transposase-like protein
VIPFFTFPPEIRRVIYITNAIESVRSACDERRLDSAPQLR